jgi:DNA replication protein DnaC
MLVLDDLDKINKTDAFGEFLFGLINHRYNHKRATVITTNLSAKEFSKFVGPALASRIFSKGGLFMELEGEDLRR